MRDTRCPGCKHEVADDDQEDGCVLTCSYCGYVGVWDGDGWRLMTVDEHTEMMQHEGFIKALEFGVAFRAWRDVDQGQLRALLHSVLDRHGVATAVVDELMRELITAEYHTHPTPAQARAMGLEPNRELP